MKVKKAIQAPQAPKMPTPDTVCDICKKAFRIVPSTLQEKKITVFGNTPTDIDWQKEYTATFLCCPHCGKHYPVVIDDEKSLLILEELRAAYRKRMKYLMGKHPVPDKINHKVEKLSRKLNNQRYKIADLLIGSSYQDGDVKEQLDYRYHVR